MPAEVEEGKSLRVLPPVPPPAAVEETPPLPEIPADNVPKCANCLTPLAGPFCAQCGQHVADYHRSVWRFVADFFDNAFCWDNKLFRTLGPLIQRPGFLTQEFMEGRRVRYVHPLRLFLFTSAICLTLLQYTHHSGADRERTRKETHRTATRFRDAVAEAGDVDDDEVQKPADSPASPMTPAAPSPPATPAETLGGVFREKFKGGSKDQDKKLGAATETLDKRLETIADRMQRNLNAAGGAQALGEQMTTNVQQKLSWVTLAMLPIFALLMRAAFGRQGGYYFTHLVFSLHYHTFLLMFWVVYAWVGTLSNFLHSDLLQLVAVLGLAVPPWYLFRALRQLYGQGWKATASKVFAIGTAHLLTLIAGLGIIGATSFL